MNAEYLMTFVQKENGFFDVKREESNLKSLTHMNVFPARFVFYDGEESNVWVNHTYEYDSTKHAIKHALYSTTMWFELFVGVDGKFTGRMREGDFELATVWMNSGYNNYYYDKFGVKEYAEVVDEDGEELPINPEACLSCGYIFNFTNEFAEGKCSACHSYDNNHKEIPNLDSESWQWEVVKIEKEEEKIK